MSWLIVMFCLIAMSGSFLVGAGMGWTAGRGQRRGTLAIALMGAIFALVCGSILLRMAPPLGFGIIHTIR